MLRSSAEGVAFTLRGSAVPRHYPAFKVKDWAGPAPQSVTFGKTKLAAGEDFIASARDGVLLLHLLRVVREEVALSIPGP